SDGGLGGRRPSPEGRRGSAGEAVARRARPQRRLVRRGNGEPLASPGRGGGSSAAPGSAPAAALVSFSVGSEPGGSIIDPTMRCGLAGLRPTFGRVPRTGAMTLSWTCDKLGPMTRGGEDQLP